MNSFLITSSQHGTESTRQTIRQERKKKKKRWHSNWKGRCKIISDCGWHNFIYRKQNAALHTLLEIKNKFNEVAYYKININISVVFVYTNKKQSENVIGKLSYLQWHLKKAKQNTRG